MWREKLEALDAEELEVAERCLPPLPIEFRGIHWLARLRKEKDEALIFDILHPTLGEKTLHSWTLEEAVEKSTRPRDAPYFRTMLKSFQQAPSRMVTTYIYEADLERFFAGLDAKLKRPLLWFLMGSYGHLDAERKLPRITRLHESRNNAIRRFFNHHMFEVQLLPLISSFLW